MRWVGHVASMAENKGVFRVLVGKPEEKRPLGRPRHRLEDNMRWIFRKWDVRAWTGSMWLRIEQVVGTCEHSNKPSGSIKCGEFLD